MASVTKFRCEVCGTIAANPAHWFVIECGDARLAVMRWTSESAEAAGARHLCGEAHAQLYISRWFEAQCSPPRPDYLTMPSG
jgi:hypothetical protein